ncbi:MAG TPA: hypothetical protein VGY54_23800 [Polyangiaceae bacterium]|nr:hypothetical protein [Polyangiaceae bacterium]
MRVRNSVTEARPDSEDADSEVPAAVVCARCGDAECPGCVNDLMRSGVIALVPWERPGRPVLERLWATARATTLDAEHFFEVLPDGALVPALRFAMISEVVASTAMALAVLGPIALLAPEWARHVLVERWGTLLRLVGLGVPLVACLLVAAHAAHGWALGLGARRSGASGHTHALRFGLYAAGWDLIIGPLGVVVLALKEGLRPALSVAAVATGLPGRSARSFLRGCYRLEGEAARPALRASYAAAVIVTLVGAIAVIAAIAWAVLL